MSSASPQPDPSATPPGARDAAWATLDSPELAGLSELERDAVVSCSRLIRFDTSNYGGGESAGELEAAEWVAAELEAAGYEPEVVEAAPGRASTIVRIPGRDRARPGLLVHGHLDVVPAESADWSVAPFGGEISDGVIWGRGALDMKETDATMLAVAKQLARTATEPPRDVVLAFVADEEDSGHLGAEYLVTHRPELFDNVGHAIGEGGGTLHRLPDGTHLYPVACGERGTAWIELTAKGTAGHGSRPKADNAVAAIAETVFRLSAIRWPVELIPQVAALLDGLADHLRTPLDPHDPELEDQLGELAELVIPTLSNTLSATMLGAGYAANVVPSTATAVIDGRMLPGHEQEFWDAFHTVRPDSVSYRMLNDSPAIATDPDDPELSRIRAAIDAPDPGALVLPSCAGGGTDNKWFSRLGIACFGFAPERMAPGFELGRYVHGVDEHVPVDCVAFGARVLDTYVRADPSREENR